MKQQSEKRTEEGVRMLLQSLARNWHDTGTILEEFENSHSQEEREQSRQYAALVTGHFALKEAMDKINNQLNKK